MRIDFELIKQVHGLSKEQSLVRESQLLNWSGTFEPDENTLSIFQDFQEKFSTQDRKGIFESPIAINTPCVFFIPLNNDTDDIYFKSTEDFFNRIKTFKKSDGIEHILNREFYIIEDDIDNTSDEIDSWKCNYESLQRLIENLKKIAHHSTKHDDLIFISHSDKKESSIVVPTSLKEVANHLVFEKKYDDFLTPIFNEDHNEIKIKSIFRSSLSELFEKTSQPNKLYYLLDNYEKLKDIYQKNYEIFVNGVSLNKIKSELAQEQLKLFEAVNKGMQEVTSRVMLVPGFAFLSMMLRSQINSPINDFWLIGIALLFISCIVLISISNQQKMLTILHETTSVSIENISRVSTDVQDILNNIINKMTGLIKDNERTLKYYGYSLWLIPTSFMLLIGGYVSVILYLVAFYFCSKFLKENFRND